MPFPDDPQIALTWNIETPYLALSENKLESSVLTEEQFEHCLGSSKYRICSEVFPRQIGHPSCIATLCFFSPINALAVCETTAITLSSIEQATNLGFGIWPITSANADFTFRESSSLATSTSSRSFAGCHICIITLACGMQIHTGHITIRSDLASCSTIKLRISLPGPARIIDHASPPVRRPTLIYIESRGRSDTFKSSEKETYKPSKSAPSQSIGGKSTSVCTGHETF